MYSFFLKKSSFISHFVVNDCYFFMIFHVSEFLFFFDSWRVHITQFFITWQSRFNPKVIAGPTLRQNHRRQNLVCFHIVVIVDGGEIGAVTTDVVLFYICFVVSCDHVNAEWFSSVCVYYSTVNILGFNTIFLVIWRLTRTKFRD